MPETHDVGPFFWHAHRFPDGSRPKLLEKAITSEYEPPYRLGTGFALRLWPSRRWAVVLGRWEAAAADVEQHLLGSMDADLMRVDLDDLKQWQRPANVRRSISSAMDLDEL